jgi:hypothetical protein
MSRSDKQVPIGLGLRLDLNARSPRAITVELAKAVLALMFWVGFAVTMLLVFHV